MLIRRTPRERRPRWIKSAFAGVWRADESVAAKWEFRINSNGAPTVHGSNELINSAYGTVISVYPCSKLVPSLSVRSLGTAGEITAQIHRNTEQGRASASH